MTEKEIRAAIEAKAERVVARYEELPSDFTVKQRRRLLFTLIANALVDEKLETLHAIVPAIAGKGQP